MFRPALTCVGKKYIYSVNDSEIIKLPGIQMMIHRITFVKSQSRGVNITIFSSLLENFRGPPPIKMNNLKNVLNLIFSHIVLFVFAKSMHVHFLVAAVLYTHEFFHISIFTCNFSQTYVLSKNLTRMIFSRFSVCRAEGRMHVRRHVTADTATFSEIITSIGSKRTLSPGLGFTIFTILFFIVC